MNEQMSLKEAILIRKMENDRSLKSKWDINRNLPRVGGRYTKSTADVKDNSAELRQKLMKNREKLVRLLNHAPDLIATEKLLKARPKTAATNANDLKTQTNMSSQLHGRNIYPVNDASSSDEETKDPAPESYLNLSDEECNNGRSASFLYTLPKRHNRDSQEIRTRSGRLYTDVEFNHVKPKIISSSNRYGDGTKRKPLSHTHKLSNYARRNPVLSKPMVNQGPVIKLPYVSKGGEDYRTSVRNSETLTNNLPFEEGNRNETLQNSPAFQSKSPENNFKSTTTSKPDKFISRGALSSSGYSSLSGNGSFSSSTSSTSFTTSSSPLVTTSDNCKTEHLDTNNDAATEAQKNDLDEKLTLNSEKSQNQDDIDSEDVFPISWLDSSEFNDLVKSNDNRTNSLPVTNPIMNDYGERSDTVSNKTKSISSKLEFESSHIENNHYCEKPKVLVGQNSISMVEKPEPAKVKRRNSGIGGSVRLRSSRSKKNEAARNSLLFAYQTRGAADALSNVSESEEATPDSSRYDRNTLSLPLNKRSNHCDVQKPLSATSPGPMRAFTDKSYSPVARAIHRRMSERSVSSRYDSESLSTLSSTTESGSSPSKRADSSSSLNPPSQPLGKPPRLEHKPSLRNRLKGAFSFQNLRRAISSEKIEEEQRLKSISHSYLNEYGEDIAKIPATRNKGRPQSISGPSATHHGSLYKPPSIGSMFGSVRMRSKKVRERRAILDRNSIACDPKPVPDYDYSSRAKKPPIGKQNQDGNVGAPGHFRPIGKVLKMNVCEGTMLIEMNKPSSGPFGFYVAKTDSGITYVSSLSDSYPDKMFAGLMKTGDRILEINDKKVDQLHLDQVYDLILENDRLIIKTIPSTPDAT